MRARSAFFAGAGSVAILAIGWQAGVGQLSQALPTSQPVAAGAGATESNSSGSTTTKAASSNSTTGAAPATESAAPVTPSATDGTFDGAVINTRYGTVQVQAVISGGQISDVVAVKLTDADRRSVAISQQVAPMVREEVLSAQSAHVANITGGTYTTQAYLQSLQAALDAAGFTG